MNAYFDTSVVTKWYLPEPDSNIALRARARFSPPLVLTHLHKLELMTAWQLKVFRKELPGSVVEQALGHLEDDVASGLWEMPGYDLLDVFAEAERLSRRHAVATGARSLDFLHVAGALVLGSTALVTADERQARLAKAAGLTVTILKSREG